MDNSQAARTLQELISAQDEAQAALRTIEDRHTRERFELLISRAQLRARELQQWLGVVAIGGSVAPTATPAVPSSQDFAPLLSAIKAKYGPDAIQTTGSSRGTGNETNYVMQKFARAVIGTNNVDCCARV